MLAPGFKSRRSSLCGLARKACACGGWHGESVARRLYRLFGGIEGYADVYSTDSGEVKGSKPVDCMSQLWGAIAQAWGLRTSGFEPGAVRLGGPTDFRILIKQYGWDGDPTHHRDRGEAGVIL